MAATSSFLYISFLREMSLSGVNQNHCQENQILCHCHIFLIFKGICDESIFFKWHIPFFWTHLVMHENELETKEMWKKNPSYYICNRQIPKSIQWLLVTNELKFYKELNFFPRQEWKSVYQTRHDFVCIKCMIATSRIMAVTGWKAVAIHS